MNLQIENQLFIVGGATSGFGKAIAELLMQEGATVIAVARTESHFESMQKQFGNKIEAVVGDMTKPEMIERLQMQINGRQLHGLLVNAGGPPAKTVMETSMQDWDDAYANVMRWKVMLTKALLPLMQEHKYGKILFIESASVKQPMDNLVLSNSFRLAVTGFAKTLSNEIAATGININVMAPGFHATPAMDRLFKKKMDATGISLEAAKAAYEQQTKMGNMGEATDFASLAVWLLSPLSKFITGQTFSVDGGYVAGVFG